MKKLCLVALAILLVAGFLISGCADPSPAAPSSTAPSPTAPSPTAPSPTTPSPTAPSPTAPSPTAPEKPQYGGIFRWGANAGPAALGVTSLYSGTDFNLACMETLLYEDSEGRNLPGSLCTELIIAPDLMSVTMHLRKGVKFHDGTDFNAEAAKWNLDMFKSGKRSDLDPVDSIDILDEYTIRLNLNVFYNNTLGYLATPTGQIVSPTATEKNGVEWAIWNPVGTGPFKFVSYEKDIAVIYERFDDYWGEGLPYLDGFEIITIKDPLVAVAALQAGEIDFIFRLDTKFAADLKTIGYTVDNCIGEGKASILVPDGANPDSPFADKRVREAVEYAIDRKAIADTLGRGFWDATNQLAPPDSYAYVPGFGRTYNPDKARELLAEAGFPDGFKTSIIVLTTEANCKDECTAIQGYLARVGIDAELILADAAKWGDYRYGGWQNGLCYVMVGGKPNMPGCWKGFFMGGRRIASMYDPAGSEDLLVKGLIASDFETREALAQEYVRMVSGEAMVVPLWIKPTLYAMNPDVRDLEVEQYDRSRPFAADAWFSK